MSGSHNATMEQIQSTKIHQYHRIFWSDVWTMDENPIYTFMYMHIDDDTIKPN